MKNATYKDLLKITTYKDLLGELSMLSEEQLEQTATIYNSQNTEYYAILSMQVTGSELFADDGVLDTGHFVLTF